MFNTRDHYFNYKCNNRFDFLKYKTYDNIKKILNTR